MALHTIHSTILYVVAHQYFTCNYGQYFTTCDRLAGSFREPAPGDDPLVEASLKTN